MFRFFPRLRETASNKPNASTAYNLPGTAATGFRTYASKLSNAEEVVVLAEEVDGSGVPSGAWEIVECTYTTGTPNTLVRDRLLDSSTGSLIDWSTATGEDASPRLSIVDRYDGMGRVIGKWDHADTGNATTIEFIFTPVAGRRYLMVGDLLRLDGSGAAYDIQMRYRLSGSWNSGTNYTQQFLGRNSGSFFTTSRTAQTEFELNINSNMYGSGNAGFSPGDEFSFRARIAAAAESKYTSMSVEVVQGFTNIGAYLCTGTIACNFQQESAIQGVQLLNSSTNFDGGNVTLHELGEASTA